MIKPLTTAEQVKQSEDRIKALETEMMREAENLKKLRIKHSFEIYGVKAGSTVTCRGEVLRVTEVESRRGQSKPWVRAARLNKDGKFGNSIRQIFDDWTLIES